MLNCVYHPVHNMQVVDDETKDKLIASGEWFSHPSEAKKVREKYERQIRHDGRKGSKTIKHERKTS